ncbi:polymorphic toxin type 15 domain-containing protein [Cellulomonas sp. URHB0016]
MSGALIDPSKFPAKSADLDPSHVTASATSLRTMGHAVSEKTGDVKTSWDRLSGCYRAPEQEKVFAVMGPAVTSAADLKSRFDDASRHLDTYAGALSAIKPRLADLERRAREFRASVVDGVWVDASDSSDASFGDHMKWAFDWVPGVDERRVKVPWNQDGETFEKNQDLLEEYARILADISTAASTCANAVNGLVTNMCMTPVEAIPAEAFTSGEVDMPWGSPGLEDRNCRESVGHGTYEWGKGLVQGVGMLILGYNPENGDWFSGDAYGQSWGGLGDLVGSVALMASPAAWVAIGMGATGQQNGFTDFMYDRAVVVRNAGGSLVGWDPNAKDGWHAWKEDGVAAGTGAVLNIGTLFIPGAGEVSGGLKAASIGARLVKISAGVTEFAVQGGSWIIKGGVKVVVGIKLAVKGFDLDELLSRMPGNRLAVAGAGGVRLNGSALVAAMTDAGRATPSVHQPHTPVSNGLFGHGGGVPDVTPPTHASAGAGGGTTVPHVETPTTNGTPHTPPVHDPHTGAGTGTDGTTPHQPTTNGHAPEWEGGTHPDGRPDVTQVPREHWNDPAYDPSHPHYDGTPRGEHGNIGTVDPDVPSPSGLTDSGRLLDPNVIPEELRPYVDNGTVINDNGVLRLADDVQLTFERKKAWHDPAEFLRQLDLQERAINQMSLGNWTERFDAFVERLNNQGPYRAQQITLLADRIMAERGVSHGQAVELAGQELARQDPLHGPDQRAGGDPFQFTGMGERGVNRSIGSQWKTLADDMRLGVRDALRASGLDPKLWGDVRMSVKFDLRDVAPAVA